MATTLTNSNGTTALVPHVRGDQKVIDARVVDTAYATGGTVITPASCGLVQIDAILSASTKLGKPTHPTLVSGVWSVQVFSAIGTEVTDTTDLTLDPYRIQVVGK